MSSIRKCFEHAEAVLEGKLEAPLEDVKDEIAIIEQILRQSSNEDYFRCCNEMQERDGVIYIYCDRSPVLPLDVFKTYCSRCASSIRKELPELKKRYNILKRKKQ